MASSHRFQSGYPAASTPPSSLSFNSRVAPNRLSYSESFPNPLVEPYSLTNSSGAPSHFRETPPDPSSLSFNPRIASDHPSHSASFMNPVAQRYFPTDSSSLRATSSNHYENSGNNGSNAPRVPAPSLSFNSRIAPNCASYPASSQHPPAEPYSLTNSSGIYGRLDHYEYSGNNASYVRQQEDVRHPVYLESPFNPEIQHEPHFLANSSKTPSTPSDYYDEDAENIDPNANSLEEKEEPNYRPISARYRPTNILCDSQAHPVSSTVALPHSHRVQEDAEKIAAPVPLPYSARSKEVLSAMISPIQPPGFPMPLNLSSVPEERSYPQSSQASENFSSNAPKALNYNYSTRYPVANAGPRKHIRPITPSTLIALTEPFLMAWNQHSTRRALGVHLGELDNVDYFLHPCGLSPLVIRETWGRHRGDPATCVPARVAHVRADVFFVSDGVYYWATYGDLKRIDGLFASHDDFLRRLGEDEGWDGGDEYLGNGD
ncbi:hypothetical protein C8R44DRAFT_980583 [Mycena epipterygia]|nr:hypothetical protein C8R44DRAFT_980583 [Mycena epipterygia]